MTEDDAKAWFVTRFGQSTTDRIAQFLDGVVSETASQNLIAPSTVSSIWTRHALDSAQLAMMAPACSKPWLDVGTGGGFPGMIVALLRPEPIILVEPRRRRAAFLTDMTDRLGLSTRVSVIASRVETVVTIAGTISARAVASAAQLLAVAGQCSNSGTTWMLPRGRFASEELESLCKAWHFVFHVEHSITNPESSILILREVRRR